MNKGEATSETADIIGTLGLREPFQAEHATTYPQSPTQPPLRSFCILENFQRPWLWRLLTSPEKT